MTNIEKETGMNKTAAHFAILYCEDDALAREMMVSSLKSFFESELTIVECQNGIEGIKEINERGIDFFDLILSDFEMLTVGGDGLSLLRYARSVNGGRKTPFVMHTASSRERIEEGYSFGNFFYVSKVQSVPETLVAIKNVIDIL